MNDKDIKINLIIDNRNDFDLPSTISVVGLKNCKFTSGYELKLDD